MEESNIYQPTESELEILQVLWAHQPSSVRFIHEQLSNKRQVGYTTILKQLQRMTDKQMVSRKKKGKTHYYSAVPREEEVQQSLFKRLLNTAYKGSAKNLVMDALGQSKASLEEIEEIQKFLEEQKKQRDE